MKFGEFPLAQVLGGTLAHAIRLPSGRLKKGHVLTETDIRALAQNKITHVMVAILEPGDPQPRERKTKMPDLKNIAALVLAAGQSKRMGQENKLLLSYQGKTVLSHVLEKVRQAGLDRIFAVTGHQSQEIEQEISGPGVTVLYNDLYQQGMSSSVKLGIGSLPQDVDAVIILLGDMPNISAGILKKIMAAYNPAEGRSIIIPTHNGKRGNPILWDRALFSEFDRLDGDMGAKILLNEFPQYIHEVEIGSDAIFLDIDTSEAYERLRQKYYIPICAPLSDP